MQQGDIELRGVKFWYLSRNAGAPALMNVSLSIEVSLHWNSATHLSWPRNPLTSWLLLTSCRTQPFDIVSSLRFEVENLIIFVESGSNILFGWIDNKLKNKLSGIAGLFYSSLSRRKWRREKYYRRPHPALLWPTGTKLNHDLNKGTGYTHTYI